MEMTLKEDPYPEYVANEDVRAVNLEHVLPLNPDDSGMLRKKRLKLRKNC